MTTIMNLMDPLASALGAKKNKNGMELYIMWDECRYNISF